MEYLLLANESPEDYAARDDPERAEAYWAGWTGYLAALSDAGVLRGAGGLHPPSSATTLRLREGQRLLQDGPFAETKEQLGGYFVLDLPDLDAALEWAGRCPSATTGSVEVRPQLAMPPAGR